MTLSGSTFSHDSVSGTFGVLTFIGGGGGAYVDVECVSGPAAVAVSNNKFLDDSVDATGGTGASGGGLFLSGTGLIGPNTVLVTLTQNGNQFSSDSVTGSITNGLFMGGGELIVGARVTSVGDSFTQDSIPGPDGVSGISWGAGLSTLGGGTCAGNPTVTSTFTNLVATGNMMGAPTGGATSGGAGAGIYAGCSPNRGGSYHLT